MAIKERKQITGTTAQIDAYAGHEGQIVWDKEKKTFVGMSGTAGNNYPLAPKEYVDNEVAKCLPLTGGELTGSLTVKGMSANVPHASIYTKDPSKELMIVTGNDDYTKGGGYFALYGRDHELQGSWLLGARSGDGVFTLDGRPDGTLTWGDRPVVYSVVSRAEDPWCIIRYSDGVQIFYGSTRSDSKEAYISYPLPFSRMRASFVDHVTAYSTDWNPSNMHVVNTTGASIGFFSYLAIGSWN